MNISESLSTIAAEFKTWRKQKAHCRTPVPNFLRERAVSLLERYQPGQVTSG